MKKELNGKYPAQIEADQQRKNQLLEWWMDFLQSEYMDAYCVCTKIGIHASSEVVMKMIEYSYQFEKIQKWASDKLQVMFAEESLEILIKEFDIR
jgi:hypothetical protein